MSLYIVDIHGEIEGDYEIIRKYEDVLDKIRAEIASLKCFETERGRIAPFINGLDVLQIIDKYKAEREALADIYKPTLRADLCIMDEYAFMLQAESEGKE